MKINDNTKGILYALGAALAVSNVYIFSKAALNEVHLAQFGVYWFGLGILWNGLFLLFTGKYKKISKLSGKSLLNLIIIAFLEMFSTLFFFLAIKTVSNPAVVSFLANINPLFVTIFGIVLLRERFNSIEFMGMTLLLTGTIIISLFSGAEIDTIFIPGVQWVILAGLIYSVATIFAKKQVKIVDPSILSLSRIIMLFVFSYISLIWLDLSFEIPYDSAINITIGSILGPFLTATLGYLALSYIEASKAAMVRSVRSLFVMAGAYLYFNNLPTTLQIIGGMLTILGVVLISLGKILIRKSS